MAAPPQGRNDAFFSSETRVYSVTVRYRSDNTLVDLTGATITWIVKQGSTTAYTKSVGSGIAVTGTGSFTITLTSSNTSTMSGAYTHECVVVLADGTRATVFTGMLQVATSLV